MRLQPGEGDPGPAVADADAAAAHQRGLQRSDEVVQQLAVAKYALTIEDMPRAMAAIDAALASARRVLSDLLEQASPAPDPQVARYAGSMVRQTAAGSRSPRMQAAPHDVAAQRHREVAHPPAPRAPQP